jgi:hypothetical protein
MKTVRFKSETVRSMLITVRVPEGTEALVITPSHLGGAYVRVTVPQTVEMFLPADAIIAEPEGKPEP